MDTVKCPHCGLSQFDRGEAARCKKCRRQLWSPERIAEAEALRDAAARRAAEITARAERVKQHNLGERIGQRLREIRVAKGISQRALAQALNRPRTWLSKLDRHQAEPIISSMLMLTRILGVSAADLLNEDIPVKQIAAETMGCELMEDAEFIKDMARLAPRLTRKQRDVLIWAALKYYRKGQQTFEEWMEVQ